MNLPSSVLRRLVVVRSAFAASLLLVTLASKLTAASYYVDYAGGVDSNAGTSTSGAWKHCPGDPAGTSAAAATNLTAGDTVFFKGGVSYVFTGGTGIVLRWNGSAGQPITYDGNSNAAWGVGSAKFTDNFGSAAISAFSSAGNASYLAFKSLDLGAIGGAASLPADQGTAVAARFGGGIVFNGSVVGTVIDSCSFHDLGYAFAQHPMSRESINGTGIAFRDCNDLTITNSTFARTGVGIQMAGSTALSALTITNCTFLDAMVWTINQPADATLANVSVSGCTDSTSNVFDRLVWNGYGPSPRVTTKLVIEGTSATLTASDIASPAASFQWMKNGAPIAGATTSRLDFAAAALGDAGVYSVTATNSSGTTLSNDAILTISAATSTPTSPTSPSNPTSPTNPVASAPVITTQPASTTVAPFATAVFSVVASGSPAPTYQWQRSGIAIPGWTSATLSLEGISSNDVGAYNVVVTNSAGSVTSATVTLSVGTATQVPVAVAPTITTQPVGQTVTVAANVTFTVAATGTPTPSLQWLKDGAPLAGRTSATLTLSQVALTDAGAYTVSVSNSAGTVTSNAGTLVVLSPTVAPSFTTQPVSQTVASLSSVTFTAAAAGAPAPTYQWTRNGITIPGWTSASLTLDGISTNDIGSYAVTATNSAGTATSNSAVLSVTSTPSVPSTPTTSGAPIITAQPTNQTAAAFSTVHFSVTASGSPAPTYQWTRNGTAFTGWTGATLTLEGVSSNDVGTYSVTVTNSLGSVTSQGATLSVGAAQANSSDGSPVITLQPANQVAAAFSTVTFTAAASGSPTPTYQWTRNGTAFAGWTGATLVLEGVSTNDIGAYAVTATNSAGSVTSIAAMLTVTNGKMIAGALQAGSDSRLTNLSVRSTAGSGSDSLIVGFVVSGDSRKSIMIRGSGPALASFGVAGTLADPTLSLHAGSTLLASNDDWNSSATADEIAPTSKQVGAFAFGDQSQDAALVTSLAAGAYTAQLSGKDGSQGIALVELYDTAPSSASRLVNVSVRASVSATNSPIIGFVVEGNSPKRLLVRAVGPSLTGFGVDGALSDPQLDIVSNGATVQHSDDWSGSAELAAAFDSVGAFPLTDASGKDAATIITAAPGAYSVVVSGANNTSGTVIVEVYELP